MVNKKIKHILNDLLSRKYIANILVILAISIMILIVSKDFSKKTSKTVYNNTENNISMTELTYKTDEERIEARLKEILEKIENAGEVQVMVTFEESTEIIPAFNTTKSSDITEEKDSGGGVRILNSENITETIAMNNGSNSNQVFILKEIKPKINGVIVVADGAKDLVVKEKLYNAVKTVLQIPGHKVEIY
ncbi:MAG: stage III sporulation protein AG [Clostridiales bacterium]|nr:stage III sporulation protein AG [Clostridiales bacterium]